MKERIDKCEICGEIKVVNIYYFEENNTTGILCNDCIWVLKHFNYKLQPFKNFIDFIRNRILIWGNIEDETGND